MAGTLDYVGLVESTKIRYFVSLAVGVFFSCQRRSGEMAQGLLSLFLAPWLNSVLAFFLATEGLIGTEGYLGHRDIVFSSL